MKEAIFGEGGARRNGLSMANTELLGQLPLDMRIRIWARIRANRG